MGSRSLNRATLIGNLGVDPELRSTPTGTSVCTVRMATTDKYKDRNNEWQEVTDWHNVVFWDKLAEIASQYLKKGDKIYIEGRIRNRAYERDGVTRYITEIVAQNLIMLGGRSGDVSFEQNSYSQDSHSASNPLDAHLAPDDDIPF